MANVEQSSATVEVPYLLNDPVIEAEQELKEVGLSWKLFGDPRQHSYVKSQSPFPGHIVPRGSVIELYCVNGPTP
jgi:beta-lactam-binding protein with PASTA domain